MRYFIFYTHTAVSFVFFLLTIIIVVKSVIGITKKKHYSKLDKNTTILCLVSLYIQFVLGFAIYFLDNMDINEKSDIINLNSFIRFWTVEHIILMLFAMIIAQIGQIIISKTNNSRAKFKKRLLYFSTVFVFVIFSLFVAIYK